MSRVLWLDTNSLLLEFSKFQNTAVLESELEMRRQIVFLSSQECMITKQVFLNHRETDFISVGFLCKVSGSD